MSRKVNEPEFCNEWKIIKSEFERCAKLIKNYETRPLSDTERIVRYKNEIINGYNQIVQYIKDIISTFEIESQENLLNKIDNAEVILRNRLQILNFAIEFPPDRLDFISNECIKQVTAGTKLNEAGTSVTANDTNDISLEFIDTNSDKSSDISKVKSSIESRNEQINLESQHNFLINNINIPVESNSNSIMDKAAFASLMASNIRNNYSGDPLSLSSFIASIDFLKEMATSAELLTLLLKFIRTKLEGRAAEIMPDNVESIDALMRILKEKIKHENSKVIEGRMMALRADRAKFQDYANQVEELSDALRRTLISDGMPQALAERQVIDRTIELCRSNTQNHTVKSVLVSKNFENAKEVVAEFIIQSNTVRQEAQVLSLRKHQNGNSNNSRNFRQGNFNNRRNFRFSQNSNRSNRNFNNNRGGGSNRNNNGGANNNRDNGNRYSHGRRNENRNVRVAENVTASQSTLGSASE